MSFVPHSIPFMQTTVAMVILFSLLYRLDPSPEERNAALASALTDILWKAGGGKEATVALPSSHPQHRGVLPSRSYTPDQLTERVNSYISLPFLPSISLLCPPLPLNTSSILKLSTLPLLSLHTGSSL